MKKFTLLLACVLLASGAWAQKRSYVVRKASVSPVIDGQVDAVWAEADSAQNIDLHEEGEFPTLGEPGETTWQGLWDWDGIYILLNVTDDDFHPHYDVEGAVRWEYDSPEIYFDVNALLEDGGAPVSGDGHYQFAPSFDPGRLDGTPYAEPNGFTHAFLVEDPNYTAEYFIPLSVLLDVNDEQVDLEREVGFDISLIDRDVGDDSSRVAVWNNNLGDGSWNNMDDCGILTFDEAGVSEYITSIALTGGTISENNGTLQIAAEILPENASNKNLEWSIENTAGKASINSDGVVRAIADGEVTVTAKALDGSYEEATATVTISGQIVSLKEVNVIRNPDFDQVNGDGTATEWTYWGGENGDPAPQVIGGIVAFSPTGGGNQLQFRQNGLDAMPDADYWFSFVAWSDETREITVAFEDTENEWNRYGETTDPRNSWGDGQSTWTFDITPEPIRYTFDVIFTEIVPTTNQTVVWHVGDTTIASYLDSLELVSAEDYGRITDYKPVELINVSGAGGATDLSINTTLQMSAEVLPLDADYLAVKWSVVNGTGEATIDENGLLTGVSFGSVTVVASAVDDSEVIGELDVKVGWPAGMAPARGPALKVYPNPVEGTLHVELTSENSVVTIYNSLGNRMDEVQASGYEIQLDVSDYTPGIYFLKSGNTVAKFVK